MGLLGNTLGFTKKYSEAVEILKKALELNPDDSDNLYYLAIIYSNWGKFDSAADIWLRVLNNPQSSSEQKCSAYKSLGANRVAGGKWKEAIEYYTNAINCDPGNLSSMAGLGDSYRLGQKYDDARKWYQKIVDSAPKSKDAEEAQKKILQITFQ